MAAAVDDGSSCGDPDDEVLEPPGRAFRRKEVAMSDWADDSFGSSRDVVDPANEESEGIAETGGVEGAFARRGVVLIGRARGRDVLAIAERNVRGEKKDMLICMQGKQDSDTCNTHDDGLTLSSARTLPRWKLRKRK